MLVRRVKRTSRGFEVFIDLVDSDRLAADKYDYASKDKVFTNWVV